MASLRNKRLVAVFALVVVGLIAVYVASRSSKATTKAAAVGTPARDGVAASSSGGAAHRDRGDAPDRVTRGTSLGGEDELAMIVEGRVLDGATGAPQASVEVEFTLPGHEGPRAEVIATSADDGRYRVEISTGRWDVRAHGSGVWAPPSRLLVEPPTGAATVHHDVLVERAAIVRGHVLDDRGAPVATATISVETTDPAIRTALDETLGRSATAGSDGAFELTVPPGEVKLHATTPSGAEGFAGAAVAPGTDVTVDITIPAAATIAGIVRGSDEAPAAGATVHLYARILGGGADQHLVTKTDSSGTYVFTNVHPGTVTIEASRDDATSPPTKQKVTDGETLTIDLTLGEPVAVRGKVLRGDGEPVAGARVNAVLQGSHTKIPGVDTDADGSFTLTVGQPGTYVVTGNGDDHSKARIVVEIGADPEPIDVVLQDPGGIRGLVTLAGGAPATTATIKVTKFRRDGAERDAPRGRLSSRTMSAGDGTFSLPEMLPGVYDLAITAPGRADAQVTGVIVPEGGWADVVVTLTEEPS